MRLSIPLLLEAAYASWAAQEMDEFLACFADDMVFANHMSPEVVPFAGIVQGKTEFRRQLQKILDEFDVVYYRPVQIIPDGKSVRAQTEFQYRHKATGLTYEGRLRHLWQIEDDKIVRFDEFHDSERTRAFFELVALYRQQRAGGEPPAGTLRRRD